MPPTRALAVGNGALVLAMWVRHGGLHDLGSLSAQLTAVGQMTALLGTYVALIQIVLMSRSPWLDQLFGMERLAGWHRWLGFACLWLLLGHTASRRPAMRSATAAVVGETWTLITTYPYILMAWVGLGAVRARRRDVGAGGPRGACRTRRGSTSTCTHTSASPWRSCTRSRWARISSRTRLPRAYWVGLYVVVVGARSSCSGSATVRAFVPAPPAGGRRRRGRRRRGVRLRHRAAPRPARRPAGPVFPLAVPGRRRLVACASVLDLGRAERRISALHRQGHGATRPRSSSGAAGHAGRRRRAVRGVHGEPATRRRVSSSSPGASASHRCGRCSKSCRRRAAD